MPAQYRSARACAVKGRLLPRYFLDALTVLVSQQPQQTGVLLSITQQVQPALSMQLRHSQQAWIISQHLLSPLVQVTHTPLSVISHLQ